MHKGATATIQGYGKTETGSFGTLVETNVTVISNEECREMLSHNASRKSIRRKGTEHLPLGLNYGMFCGQGSPNDEGTFSGSCKGDSGGPLTIVDQDNQDRSTLIGIVSGGIGCGRGIPGWYTKVSFHTKWIRCIIDKSLQFRNNQRKVEEACQSYVKSEPACVNRNDLIFGEDEFNEYVKGKGKGKNYTLCDVNEDKEDGEDKDDDEGKDDVEYIDASLFNLREDEADYEYKDD